jgi:TRAP-type mannitol/chloroaromatic compound transport system substrate-binding protein
VDAASANMMWKAIDRNSQDYITLQSVDKVKFYKTPASILQKQLELYDQVIAKKSAENPLFTEIVASQKKFAERAVKWEQDVVVSRTLAYNHYFGPKAAAPGKG